MGRLHARIRWIICFALFATLCFSSIAATPALSPAPQWPFAAQPQSVVFFPWLPNGQRIGTLGPWHSVAILQNIEEYPITIDLWQPGDYTHPIKTLTLPSHGIETIAPEALFTSTDEGAHALVATARPALPSTSNPPSDTICNKTFATRTFVVHKGGQNTADTIKLDPSITPKVIIIRYGAYESFAGIGQLSNDHEWRALRTTTGLSIDWRATRDSTEPDPISTNANYDVILPVIDQQCSTITARIAGAVKLVEPLPAPEAITSQGHAIVSGYTALGLTELLHAAQLPEESKFADLLASTEPTRWAFPIVQSNNGWESVIHLTNLATAGSCKATIDLLPSAEMAMSHQPLRVQAAVTAGATRSLHLVDLLENNGVSAQNWVGQAWITAPCPVVASVDRIKPSTLMALTNVPVARAADSPRVVTAPLIFQSYNGWNSGINISNLSDSEENLVTLSFYDTQGTLLGKVERTLPPSGMTFVYRPSFDGAGIEGLSQATVVGTEPIAVAVDAVKYQGNKLDGQGQALSYLAPSGAAEGEFLTLPLVQKGDGSQRADTSGINLFNTSATTPAEVVVRFFDHMGHEVPSSTQSLTLAPHSGQTLYTPRLSALTPGFHGSAVVAVRTGGPVSAISNNVNYAVAVDGSTTFSLVTTPPGLPMPQPTGEYAITLTASADISQINVPIQLTAKTTGSVIPITLFSLSDHSILWFNVSNEAGQVAYSHVHTDPQRTDQVLACIDLDLSLSCDQGEPRAAVTLQWVNYQLAFPADGSNPPYGDSETVQLTVLVTDIGMQSHSVAGARVLFSILEEGNDNPAPAVIGSATPLTDANGKASVTILRNGSEAGTTTIVRACVDVNRNGQCDSTSETAGEPHDDWIITWSS
ncbi:Ig-like domain-containing protein [Thermorudis peleae]|uniref:Ig-like domain-containing protein n=1 Tax=Thermorudis peleae TaxID=1382356 RepID=UPI00056FFF10|nr:Ig-like domain-containing protein [Thermorudis peleae]